MLNKLWTDLKTKGHFVSIIEDPHSEKLGYYYILFGTDFSKLNKLIKDFDEEGIPVNRAYIDVKDGKPHYYPISIGQVGLSIFHQYLKSGDQAQRDHFLRIAKWFVRNHKEDARLGCFWLTDIPKPEYQVYSPWKSAFTQSRALSILLRAWQETGDSSYLELATKALKSFEYDIQEGGVAIRRKSSEIFYEEYVAEYPTRVLDGHIFSLFGLYDYLRAVSTQHDTDGHNQATRLFEEGVQGLIDALPHYDLGYWLLFNRCEVPGYPEYDPCTINYLQLVCRQLEILFKITEMEVFSQYQEKFRSYIVWPNIVKMYKSKFSALKNLNRI